MNFFNTFSKLNKSFFRWISYGQLLLCFSTTIALTNAFALNINYNKGKVIEINSRPGGLTAPGVFKKISQAHKYLADNKYDQALARLKPLENKSGKPYSLAQVLQTIGYIYSGKDQDAQALKYFKKSLDLKAFPLGPTKTNLYMISQLLVGQKKYNQALSYLENWFQINSKPTAAGYVLLATILVEKGQRDNALKYVNKALEIANKPKESWLQFAAGLNMEKGNYKKAAFALNKLVTINPNKASYWKMLAGCYLNMDQNKKALSALSVANQLGFVKSEQDILNLASLYATNGVPLSSAKLVEKSMQEGKIKKNKKNLQFLAQTWLDSEDKDKAIGHLKNAAKASPDGKLYLLEGQVHMEKGRWQKAVTAFTKAIKKGKLTNKGQVFLLRGMANINLKKFEAAKKDFELLGEFEKYTVQSTSWLNYVKFKKEAHAILNPNAQVQTKM